MAYGILEGVSLFKHNFVSFFINLLPHPHKHNHFGRCQQFSKYLNVRLVTEMGLLKPGTRPGSDGTGRDLVPCFSIWHFWIPGFDIAPGYKR